MHYNKIHYKGKLGAWIPGALAEYAKDKGKKTVQEANGKNPEQDRRHMMTMNGGNK
jgi:hypothetical protein